MADREKLIFEYSRPGRGAHTSAQGLDAPGTIDR